MTNPLTDVRQALADALEVEGIRVLREIPQTYTPPLCWIEPRAPYREPGQTFGLKRVHLAVVCLSGSGTNAAALEAAEQMASDVADAIEALDSFRLDAAEEISPPGIYVSAQGQSYVGTPVNVIAEYARA